MNTSETISNTERLFWALRDRDVPDLFTNEAIQADLEKHGHTKGSDPWQPIYLAIRASLAPDFDDEATWLQAHRDIQALAAAAATAYDESSNVSAQLSAMTERFPGYSLEVLERILADTRFALR